MISEPWQALEVRALSWSTAKCGRDLESVAVKAENSDHKQRIDENALTNRLAPYFPTVEEDYEVRRNLKSTKRCLTNTFTFELGAYDANILQTYLGSSGTTSTNSK